MNGGLAKPEVFVGSSVERLDIANTLQEHLEYEMNLTVWNQDIFRPSSFALIDLERAARRFHFAIFVFAPDDIVTIREDRATAVRDNVVFEFGLFVGALGLARCFLLMPRGQETLHLPTDLLGLTPLTYAADRLQANMLAALGPAANRVRRAVREQLCPQPANAAKAFDPPETKIQPAEMAVEPTRASQFLGAEDYDALWNSGRFKKARNLVRDMPLSPYGYDEDELDAHRALRELFALLESMADGVLAGTIDESAAKQIFEQPVLVLWPHMFTLMAPPNHAEDWWDPAPRIAELYMRWSR